MKKNGDRRGSEWILAYPNTDYDNYGDDLYYFYLDSKGKPFLANDKAVKDGKLKTLGSADRIDDDDPAATDVDACDKVGAKAIKGETYLFNENGVMLTGLYKLNNVSKGTGSMENGLYYFTEDDYPSSVAGQLVTNKRITIDVDGDDETYYFDKTGKAYQNTIISSSLYGADGALVDEFGDGSTYAIVSVDPTASIYEKGKTKAIDLTPIKVDGLSTSDSDTYTLFLLNGNGKIKKNGTVTDVDGYKVTVKDYKVTKIEDKN